GVGAGTARLRGAAGTRTPGRGAPDLPAACRATGVASHLHRLASPVGVRLRAPAPALAPSRRARDVSRRGGRSLVAGDPRSPFVRRESCLCLCGLSARIADRARARARSPPDLLVLRARAAQLGTGAARRSTARR